MNPSDKYDPEFQRELYQEIRELYEAYMLAGFPYSKTAQGMMPILYRPDGQSGDMISPNDDGTEELAGKGLTVTSLTMSQRTDRLRAQ